MTTSTVDALNDAARRYIPGGVNASQRGAGLPADTPLAFKGASGAYVWGSDGRRYLDFHTAFGAIILGHCDVEVNRRAAEAVSGIDLVGLGVTALEVDLAGLINQHVPSAERVLLCNSGTEATQHAIRLARAATGRQKIIKFQGCYHGLA